ncbi:MAG: RNA polymerase subunit sigma-70 [Acidobacteria bacterium]|nr:MAG: RNA polymerase subunit sigma-70 [Acidobacteriota bacterium]RLE32687.1 MAG: RNA polymerase subunit sigma-70 [Acidobacteriota bacterium]
MTSSKTGHITRLLEAHRQGEEAAFDQVVEALYEELLLLAHRQRHGAPRDATLNTTGLVHEAYVKMANGTHLDWNDRSHFLGVAAQAMRQISVDYARSRFRAKRGGGAQHVELHEEHLKIEAQLEKNLAVDTVLEELRESNPRLVKVVECRYFAGMTEEETAAALDISVRTVRRTWSKAKEELKSRLQPSR